MVLVYAGGSVNEITFTLNVTLRMQPLRIRESGYEVNEGSL